MLKKLIFSFILAEQRYSENRNEMMQKSDDMKRARVSTNRLYPVLSDIESTTDSEMDNYTTATVSGSESANGIYNANSEQSTKALTNDDSYEEYSEDESSMSLGREILKSVQNNEINKVIFQLRVTYTLFKTY